MKITETANQRHDLPAQMYYRNMGYASSHSEFQQYSDFAVASGECRSEIEETINNIDDDAEFKNPDVYRPLIQKYGLDCVAYNLYNAIGCDFFDNQEKFSNENRRWAVDMYAPYFLLNNSHPPHFLQLRCPVEKIDKFISGFRECNDIPLRSLKWEHERGEEYPEICDFPVNNCEYQTKIWKWSYSLVQSEDCAHDLYLIADSCASKEADKKYLTDVLNIYGPERTFTVLAEAGLILRNESSSALSKDNIKWIGKYDEQYSISNIDYSQKGRAELFNLSESSAGLNDLLTVAHEIGSELKDLSKFEPVFLYGAPALYSPERLNDYEITDPVFKNCYDLRGSDNDPGMPVAVENHVRVNYCGSVLSPARLPIPECGYLKLGENGFLMDEPSVNHDYLYGLVLSYGDGKLEEGVRDNINTENEKLVVQTFQNDIGENPGCMYGVYRISDDNSRHKFLNYKTTQSEQLPVYGKEYSLIYFSDMDRIDMSCDEILQALRDDPPASFKDYGPYTSDVIITNVYGDTKAFYVNIDHAVDSNKQIREKVSFNELPDFVKERQMQLEYTPMKLLDDQPLDTKSMEDMLHDGNDEPTGHGAR